MADAVGIAAVRPPHQQEDIRPEPVDLLDVVLRQLEGIDLDDLGACAQGSLLGRFGGQLRHKAGGDHPQSAGGGGAGIAGGKVQLARLGLQLLQRMAQPLVDIGLYGVIGCRRSQKDLGFGIDGGDFGISAAEVDQ